ncbi:MAG TPA: hypothetical protein VG013_33460 [Gemmataceae bacterium]|nr:hypothetical protein [Gemmataceae bacterium]
MEGITDAEVEGAIKAVAVHPSDANVVYVGAVNGGIWKTANAMKTRPIWKEQTDSQKSLSVGALEFDPTDGKSQTLVAGTGRFSSLLTNGGARAGLLRTTDGGAKWTSIDGGGTLNGLNVSGVAPRGRTIVVAVNDADGAGNVGIWRSTNTGAKWTQISAGNGTGLPEGASSDLAGDPTNRDRLFTNAGSNGLYLSNDVGATWKKVSNADMDALIADADNIKIAVGTSSNVYVAIDVDGQLAGVFRSGDGETNWTAMDLPTTKDGGIHPGGQGGTHLSITADPRKDQFVYIGGDRQDGKFDEDIALSIPNCIGARDYSGRLFRGDASKQKGKQWVHLTHSSSLGPAEGGTARGSAPHADSRGMKVAANGVLIEVDDGGIYRRTSPLTNKGDWFSMNGNLQTTEFHAIAWDSNTHLIIGGAQDTGTAQQRVAANARWQSVTAGDGGVVAVDASSTPGLSIRYSSYYGFYRFRRRVYNAANDLQSEFFPSLSVLAHGADLLPQFYTPIKLNMIAPTRLIIGAGNSVYESLDQGDTITEIGRGIVVNGNGTNPIAYGAAGNPDMLYVGSGAHVFVRKAPSPAALTRSVAYTGGRVVGIAIDPKDPQHAYVVDSASVYRTTNAGGMWTNITGNLPSSTAGTFRSVAYFTSAPSGAVVVGTDAGVFMSRDARSPVWSQFGSGLPTVPVYHLEYSSRDKILLAGTLGRGAWTLKLLSSSQDGAKPLAGKGKQIKPQEPNNMSDLQLANGVIIDRARALAYVMSPNGGIEAVTLTTGRMVWRTKQAAKPLGVAGNRLICQAESSGAENRLKCVVLNRANGDKTLQGTVNLPASVKVSIHETLHGQFVARAEARDGDALVSWEYFERPKSGLPPGTRAALPPGPRRPRAPGSAVGRSDFNSGAFRMKLSTGAVSPLNQVSVTVPRSPQFTELHGGERLAGVAGPQLLSVDGRHVLGSERTGDDRVPEEKYTLTVYARGTRKPLGKFTSRFSLRPFFVTDSRVVFETRPYVHRTETGLVNEPSRIRAVDMRTGKEIWSRQIRDTAFRGAMPP